MNEGNEIDKGVLTRWAERQADLEAERRYLETRLAAVRTLERLAELQARRHGVAELSKKDKTNER